jgi:hypothetical protein
LLSARTPVSSARAVQTPTITNNAEAHRIHRVICMPEGCRILPV